MPQITGGGASNITGANITDGTIADADISATAAIQASKLLGVQLPTKTLGVTTRNNTTASGAQTIAHGLGRVPNRILIHAKLWDNSTTHLIDSFGGYDGTTNACVYVTYSGGITAPNETASFGVFIADNAGTLEQKAVITVDATNITLTWTKVGTTDAGTIQLFWTAE